jgi:DNA-binding MarR family transcriptional regulator
MTNVIYLARGPLSATETVVLQAIAAAGTDPETLPALTGLAEQDLQDALAQLRRRGLIERRAPRVRRSGHGSYRPVRRLALIDGHAADSHTTPPLPAA